MLTILIKLTIWNFLLISVVRVSFVNEMLYLLVVRISFSTLYDQNLEQRDLIMNAAVKFLDDFSNLLRVSSLVFSKVIWSGCSVR